ncbi:MAG TPA: tetratricopeptide repeat protein [Candidatus Polarisedimenticolaceae bacterium]|nr:tetratricopeptide repeat protein [Candidatus Polarisedimenticolaceae bacterium]
MSRGRRAAVCGALLALTLAAYAPSLRNGLTNYDDDVYVTANPHVKHGLDAEAVRWAFTTTRAANWHPLTWIAHTLDWSAYGARPLGHHLSSLLLHAANAILLFLLLERMTAEVWPSALVAALFAAHPLHVESVAWIAERKDVLAALFWLLAAWAYVTYSRAPSARRMAVVAALMAAGLLAKPMPVTLPFALLLLDVWPLRRTDAGWRRLVAEKIPLFVLGAASCAVTLAVQRAGGAVASWTRIPLPERIGNALWSYLAYLGATVWPSGLAAIYPYPSAIPWWRWGIAAAVLAAISAIALRLRSTRPWLAVGWLWFLGTLVPVIGLVQVGVQARADRYTYVPLIGVFVMIAWSVPARMRRRLSIPAAAVVAALAVATGVQARVWRDSATLFAHALAAAGGSATAHVNLGAALEGAGRDDEALGHYEEALKLDPGSRPAHNRIAGLLARRGRLDEAADHYLDVLRRIPSDPETLSNYGIVLARQGRLPDAIDTFRAALAAGPENPASVHTNLGNALLLSGKRVEAIAEYREALRLDPTDEETRENLRLAERSGSSAHP